MEFNTLYFEITHRCNQHCKHCYLDAHIDNQTSELSTIQIKKIISDFKDQGGKFIIITGGEPFVRKDIFEILDYIEELHLDFEVATNALALNDTRLAKLKSYKHLTYLFTSILGRNDIEHQEMTTNGHLEKVFHAIESFKNSNVQLYVQITLKEEYYKGIEDILDLLSVYKNITFKVTPILETGIKSSSPDLILPKNRYFVFHQFNDQLFKQYGEQLDKSNLWTKEDIIEEISNYENHTLYSLKYGEICLRPNGSMSFSYDLIDPYLFGNAVNGFSINDDLLKNYIYKLRKIDSELINQMSKNDFIDLFDYRSKKLKETY